MVPSSIQEDIGGLGNVLRGLDTIEGEPEPTPDQIAVERRALNEALRGIHSPATGLIIPEVEVESGVSEGQCIVRLLDVSRIRSIPIHSPVRGFLHRLSRVVGNPDTRDQDMPPARYAQSARKLLPDHWLRNPQSAIRNDKTRYLDAAK